jgi:hypothetical protein
MPESLPPKFSVVIPLYNKGPFVERAIRSVLNQTVQDFEIVVVNDGSTDDGPAIVAGIGDDRIRLISQENAGVSAARNAGIANARSEMIAFLDADDEWRNEFLATIHRLQEKYPQCDMFATGYEFCYEDGRTRNPIFRGMPPGHWEGVLTDYFAVAARSDPPICSSAVAVRKSAIQSIGGFPEGISAGEDLLTWARLAVCGLIAFARIPMSVFHAGSSVTLHRTPQLQDLVGPALEALAQDSQAAGMRAYVAMWYKMRASCLLRAGQRRMALLASWKSLCYRKAQWKVIVYGFLAFLPRSISKAVFGVILRR